MTKKEFKYAAKYGFGRAIIFLKTCKNKEKYIDIIEYLITNDNAYDSLLYGTQSNYCYELINCYENKDRFLKLTIDTLNKPTNNTGLFLKLCELLSNFAYDGYNIAKKALYDRLDDFFDDLRTNYLKKMKAVQWQQLSWLCICLLQIDKEKSLEELSIKLSHFLHENKIDILKIDLWYYLYECKRYKGFKKIVNKSKDKIMVDFFQKLIKENNDLFKEEDDELENLIDLLDVNNFNRHKVRNSLKKANEQEKQAFIDFVVKLEDKKIKRECYFWIVRHFVNDYPIDVLLHDALDENRKLSLAAFSCLEKISDEKVRVFALQNIEKKYRVADSFDLLRKNYKPEDNELIEIIVKQVKVTKKSYAWHSIFSAALDIIKEHKEAKKELLYYIYEHQFCGFCRYYIVKELKRRRMLTDNIIQECKFDANDEVRKLFNKY